MNRREFLGSAAAGAAALGLMGTRTGAAPVGATEGKPLLMKVGHQHDHSEPTLKLLSALGVDHICSGHLGTDEEWSVDSLMTLRRHVASFGISLDAVPLPMSSFPIEKAELPDILLARSPGRDRAIERICQMIRHAGRAGIPLLKYNLTFLGVLRGERVPGRGASTYSSFVYDEKKANAHLTIAGPVSAEENWDRITYFLKQVVPVAEEAKVRLALHPNDPGLDPDHPYYGVHAVLASVEGLKRFVATVPSPYHGLNFCQGTISEMLVNPDQEIHDVIRYFGSRGKIFNVHFRNIQGGRLHFKETFPDDGDVNLPQCLETYREVGFDGMVMPDHVPEVAGDPGGFKAFSYCFGYIQALLQLQKQNA
jgi:mannonate dehydratase